MPFEDTRLEPRNEAAEFFRNQEVRKKDPTRTLTQRRRFKQEGTGRLGRVSRSVTREIVENDGFGLTRRPRLFLPRFFGLTNKAKVARFIQWLQTEHDREVLQIVRGPSGRMVSRAEWTQQHVRSGYVRGLEDAQARLKAAGARIPKVRAGPLLRQPIHREALEEALEQVFFEMSSMTRSTEQAARRVALRELKRNATPKQLARAIREEALKKVGVNRMSMIARTSIVRAHAEAVLNHYESQGVKEVVGQAEFFTSDDDQVCARCESLEGERFSIPEARGIIPVHVGCVLGDTLVTPGGRIAATSERVYEGDIIIIRSAAGDELACTPNHPIATPHGWVAAGLLYEGCEIVRHLANERMAVGRHDGYDEQIPSSIEEVTRSPLVLPSLLTMEVPVAPEDFHGDGVGSEVAVVRSDLELRNRLYAPVQQHRGKQPLIRRRMSVRVPLPGGGSGKDLSLGARPSSGCSMCGRDLRRSLVGRHAGPLEKFGLTAPTRGYTALQQSSPNSGARHWVGPRQGGLGFASEITPDDLLGGKVHASVTTTRITYLGHRWHSGLVFNMETEQNWYAAGGLATHNCRCSWLPILRAQSGRVRPRRAA